MKVSVVVPYYNAAETLHAQLDALSRQRWTEPWEVVLSDNGSRDNSTAIASSYADRLTNWKIIDSSKVKGPAHARNAGADAAQGESVLFCDADDEVAPGWLAAMGDALRRHDFVTCRFESHKLNEPWAVNTKTCPQESGLQTYDYPPYLPHAASAGIGIKRSIHLAIGGFDESMPMLEDTDYCWRVQLRGTRLHFVGDALIHYRYRNTVSKMMRQARLWGEYNVYIYKKYRPLGMPALSKKTGITKAYQLFRKAPGSFANKQARLRWYWDFSWLWGRTIGSVKYGVFAL